MVGRLNVVKKNFDRSDGPADNFNNYCWRYGDCSGKAPDSILHLL